MKTKIKAKKKKPAIPQHRKKIKSKKEKKVLFRRIFGLENLRPPKGARTKKKILGRGSGSGHGKTSTRGSKGQGSRAGRDFYLGFEGAQVPLIRKIPKHGFSNIRFKKDYQIVNLKDLKKIKKGVVDPQLLKEKGLVKDEHRLIKVLGEGDLDTALEVKAHAFSKQAKEKIEKSGGKTEVIHVNA